jgi:hypothetical protein
VFGAYAFPNLFFNFFLNFIRIKGKELNIGHVLLQLQLLLMLGTIAVMRLELFSPVLSNNVAV